MSEHLIRSAQARHEDTLKRATTALRQLAQAGEPITFAAVARKAGVSTDFLYGTATLRSGSPSYASNHQPPNNRRHRSRVPRAQLPSARYRPN